MSTTSQANIWEKTFHADKPIGWTKPIGTKPRIVDTAVHLEFKLFSQIFQGEMVLTGQSEAR